MSKLRIRRLRRKARAILKFGISAGPRHKLIAGRTGSVQAKRRQTR